MISRREHYKLQATDRDQRSSQDDLQARKNQLRKASQLQLKRLSWSVRERANLLDLLKLHACRSISIN